MPKKDNSSNGPHYAPPPIRVEDPSIQTNPPENPSPHHVPSKKIRKGNR